MNNDVTLLVNGILYGGWKSVNITRALDAIAGQFNIELTDKWSPDRKPWPIFSDDECTLYIGENTVITGSVDAVDMSISNEDHTISITGRDKTKDLIDCSIIECPYEFTKQSVLLITSKIAGPYGITVSIDNGIDQKVNKFAIQPGEKAFDAIERVTRMVGLLPTSTSDGNILLTRTGKDFADTNLTYNENILSAAAQYRSNDRYRDYKIIGARPGSDNSDPQQDSRVSATATDPAMRRKRALTIVADSITDNANAKVRANWECAIRAGRSSGVNVIVEGWRQNSGRIWWPNMLTTVRIEPLLVDNQIMLINEVQFTKDLSGGTTTRIGLMRPDAFLPEPLVIKNKIKTDPWASVRAATGSKLR